MLEGNSGDVISCREVVLKERGGMYAVFEILRANGKQKVVHEEELCAVE